MTKAMIAIGLATLALGACKKSKKTEATVDASAPVVAMDGGAMRAPVGQGGLGGLGMGSMGKSDPALGGSGTRTDVIEGKMGAGTARPDAPPLPPSSAEPTCANVAERMMQILEHATGQAPMAGPERAKQIAEHAAECQKQNASKELLACTMKAGNMEMLMACAAADKGGETPAAPATAEVIARCQKVAAHIEPLLGAPQGEDVKAMIDEIAKECASDPPTDAQAKCILAAKNEAGLEKCSEE